MKYLVFSDIHGNLEALETVLAAAAREDIERYVCLGDVVGYGASPNECVDVVRGLPEGVCLRGNHDAASIDPAQRTFFHEVALEGVTFTDNILTEDNRAYLGRLPYTYDGGTFFAVHASPYNPEQWEYVLDRMGAERAFASMFEHRIAFIGHSHSPVIFCDDGTAERFIADEEVELETDTKRYVINVGSVGQPRDGNPDAAFVVFDDEASTVILHRVSYDRAGAAEKILKAGLPPVLAERLLAGY